MTRQVKLKDASPSRQPVPSLYLATEVTLTLTREQALALGVLRCECGHLPNNHFLDSTLACAHCACKCYSERVVVDKQHVPVVKYFR